MFKKRLILALALGLAWGISPSAHAGVMNLDSFVDQTTPTIDVGATKLIVATVNTSGTQGGNDASATAVTIGGSVEAADIAEVCVNYGGVEVTCQASPASLTGISLGLPGNQKGGSPFDYTISLNPSAGGKTIQFTVVSITNTNLQDNIPLPASTATRTISGGVTAPTVTSPTFADVTDTTATLGGNVTNDNGTPVTSRGVEWGTSPGGPYPNSVPEGGGGTGVFTVPVTGLPSSTTIYFRAWADNGATGFSAESSFTTNAAAAPPSVTTSAATNIGQNSATLGGNVTADGGAAVTARGIWWDTTPNAENGTQVSMGSGTGEFSQLVSGLPAGTLIYFRSYATNSAGTTLGNELTFTTLAGLPTVDSPTVADVTATTATLGGTVQSNGGATVTARGVEWGTTSGGPYPNSVPEGGSGTGAFTVPVTGLPTGTLVYFRAWATNSTGTAFSVQASFTPAGPPVVTADAPAAITHNSALLGGNVTADGGSTVNARGIVWDTATPPETAGTSVPMGSGLGAFSQTVSGLPSGTLIYFKAYATNAVATGYSDEQSFTTATEPTEQATNVQFPNVSGGGMRITWTRGNGDGVVVVMRLAANAISPPVDGTDYTANPEFGLGDDVSGSSLNYVVYEGPETSAWVTGLAQTTAYSVAIYEYAGAGPNIDYLLTTPAEGSQTTTDYSVHNYDYAVDCDNCHNHGVFGARDTQLKDICVTCHNPSGVASAKLEFDNHLAPNSNPAVDFVDCGVCHELHNVTGTNTTLSTNNVTGSTQHNKSYLRANVGKYIDTAVEPAYLHTDQPKREDPHPNAPQAAVNPDRAVEGGTDAVDPPTATQARGYCQGCHTLTNYHTNNPGTSGSVQTHDGDQNNSGLGTEVNCGDCHEHNNKFIGVGGTTTCIECHDQVQGSRPIITTQFDRLTTHIPGGSAVVTQDDCLVCHDQGSHTGGIVSVWDVDDGSTTFSQLTSGGSTVDPAEAEAFEGHCLSCHDDGVASSLPDDDGGVTPQTKTSPFTGSGAPPTIDEAAWNTTAVHNRSTAPIVSCLGGCHGSGHGSEQDNLLSPASGAKLSATGFCLTCHDGTVATDVSADFAGPELSATSASGAQVSNRHNCAGCHDPHADPSGIQDINLGGALRQYSPGNSYTSDGYNFAYNSGGNLDPINPEGSGGGFSEPDYIQFCLACHDGTTPPGVTMTAGMLDIAAAYSLDDQHGVVEGSTGSRTGKGGLKFPYVTTTDDGADNDPTNPYAAMNCRTCHGAHGTGNIFNLRESINVAGTDMTVGGATGFLSEAGYAGSTTYTLPLIGGQQTDHYWGAWCTFCHKGDAHPGKVEADACTGGHMHGGGAF